MGQGLEARDRPQEGLRLHPSLAGVRPEDWKGVGQGRVGLGQTGGEMSQRPQLPVRGLTRLHPASAHSQARTRVHLF